MLSPGRRGVVPCSQKKRKRNGVSFSSLAAIPLAELQRDKRGEIKHQHVKSHEIFVHD